MKLRLEIMVGRAAPAPFQHTGPVVEIGGDPSCDLPLSGEAGEWVSSRHARLELTPQGAYLSDAGSTNGTFVNDRRVASRMPVKVGDYIRLGHGGPTLKLVEVDLSVATVDNGPAPLPTRRAARDSASPGRTAAECPTDSIRHWIIGRAPECDLVVDAAGVSARHCRLSETAAGYVLEDLGSTNGTLVNGNPIVSAVRVNRDDRITLGVAAPMPWPPAAVPPAPAAPPGPEAPRPVTVSFRTPALVLGRHPSCEHVLDYPMISARHARLCRTSSGMTIEDLGSTNGTFLNGRRVAAPAPVRPGDAIGLGSYTFTLTTGGELEEADQRGRLSLEARRVTVDVPGRRLIENVSLTILPGEFVGLMGPSGSGKTTLMNALNGYTPPSGGEVLLNGESLYANYARFSSYLGYVPQDDIIHRDLTVGQALFYSARLRLPADYSKAEIRERIRQVLAQLGLEGTEAVRIGSPERKGISGGQRKRVNLAMELLTDPLVLFLDEPTSGLSSEDTLLVMRLLRSLADAGKTILLTIHQPSLEAYRLMDNVAVMAVDKGSMAPGVLAYYGPAYPDAVHFFNPDGITGAKPGVDPSPDEVLRGQSKRKTEEWLGRFLASRYHREYVANRIAETTPPRPAPKPETPPKRFDFAQCRTLVERCLAVKAKDTWNTGILLTQAPIIAALVVIVFGKQLSQPITVKNAQQFANSLAVSIFLVALAAVWFGCSNGVREIVGERAIYHRERMINLRISSYVASKFAVLAALCLVQCATLLGIVYVGCDLRGPWLAMFFLLWLVSLVGVALGLVLSAVARTSEVAIALLPLALLPMIILGGLVQPIHQMSKAVEVLSLPMPSRWAFEGLLVLEGDRQPSTYPLIAVAGRDAGRIDMAESYFPKERDRVGAGGAVTALVLLLALLVAAVHGILRRRDIH